MSRPFPPSANWIAKASIILVLLILCATLFAALGFVRSPMANGTWQQTLQPVPFSHQHHVQGLGLDCRYCHQSVEISAHAGFPDSATCLGCHSQIWPTAPVLEKLRESALTRKSLVWTRVHQLPDYVYFDHHIHIQKGVGCVTCHGEVSQMPVVVQVRTFLMKDCQSCHDNPASFLRPQPELLNENWKATDPVTESSELMQKYQIHPLPMKDCSRCHR